MTPVPILSEVALMTMLGTIILGVVTFAIQFFISADNAATKEARETKDVDNDPVQDAAADTLARQRAARAAGLPDDGQDKGVSG